MGVKTGQTAFFSQEPYVISHSKTPNVGLPFVSYGLVGGNFG